MTAGGKGTGGVHQGDGSSQRGLSPLRSWGLRIFYIGEGVVLEILSSGLEVVMIKYVSKFLPFGLKWENEGTLSKETCAGKPGFRVSGGPGGATGSTQEKEGQLLWVQACGLSRLPHWWTTSSPEEVIRCTRGSHTTHCPVTKLWAETNTPTIPERSEKAI